MVTCELCGVENGPGRADCRACGAPLPVAPAAEKRKVVTILFSDVAASTTLGEQLDPESLRRVMSRYFREMKRALDRHGGTVEKFIGDAVMAVFGIPVLHEDDALRAVRAAADMRDALAALNDELERDWGVRIRNRTGVNTGEVVAGDASSGQSFVTGDPVNTAARLEQAAGIGEVLLGELTYRLVRDAVEAEPVDPLSLKGKAEPVPAYRLLSVRAGAPGVARRLDSPMVGREAELEQLRAILAAVAAERSPQLVTIVAPPGTGKSRLKKEFIDSLGDAATVVVGHCLPYGEGITYWPIAEIVRERARITDEDTAEAARAKLRSLVSAPELDTIEERLAKAIGLVDGVAPTEETFWAVRKLFEGLAADRPLVVVIEDIHWAEATFLDLLEYVLGWSRGAPILVLCSARPDVGELRPTWLAPRPAATTMLLRPLGEADSERLVDALLGGAELEPEIRRRIVEAAEGTPLFVEELLRMLVEDGVLREEGGRWLAEGGLDAVRLPPTVESLLAARLDRLPDGERAVLERASTVGRVFWWGAVTELSPVDARPAVPGFLQALVRRELIAPELSTFSGEDAFRFSHILMRDAAYRSMGKELRAELHERLAAWLERRAGDRVAEYEEILGYHLEQAFRYREQLGPLDDHARVLRVQAGQRLAAPGRRALARGDIPAAVNLLGRAAALLPAGTPLARGVLADHASALVQAGELARADELLSQVVDEATAAGDPGARAYALIEREFVRLVTMPEGRAAELTAVVAECLPVFERLGDDLGRARAHRLRSELSWNAGEYGAAADALRVALEYARARGDEREEAEILVGLGGALVYGPTPIDEAIEHCEQILARSGSYRRVEAATLAMLAYLRAMRGEFDTARELFARDRAILEELGLGYTIARRWQVIGSTEALAGKLAAAEAAFRNGLAALEAIGERFQLSTVAGRLAQVLLLQDRDADAEAFVVQSRETAAEDDLTSQVVWRDAEARILARRGEIDDADRLAAEAIGLAERTDDLDLQGWALVDLAEVHLAAGRTAEAAAAFEAAAGRFEGKQNAVGARVARGRRARLPGGSRQGELASA